MTIKLKKNPKISWKNSKLKQKTQNSRKKLKVREDFPSPCLPSDVKKKSLSYTQPHLREDMDQDVAYIRRIPGTP